MSIGLGITGHATGMTGGRISVKGPSFEIKSMGLGQKSYRGQDSQRMAYSDHP